MSKSIFDVLIVGGGYSGMVAAIKAAQNNKTVCIIEKNELLGRKILSTGNGRCNFTNEEMSADFFRSNSDISTLSLNYKEHIDFLKELGVIPKNTNGYYYPYTNQAKTVRDAFDIAIKLLGIKVFLNTTVKRINKADNYFIKTEDKEFEAKNVIISTGGMAAKALGTSGDGYYFAKELGIKVTEIFPALVGLKSSDDKLKLLAGVRCQGKVFHENNSCEGEIQFNKDGISGYPVMCISRDFEKSSTKKISICFTPFLTKLQLEEELTKRLSKGCVSDSLNGLLNDKCILAILNYCNIVPSSDGSRLSNSEFKKLLNAIYNLDFSYISTKGFDNAQVTAGGISLDELDMSTMMIKSPGLNGLYFTGEVVDIDGICGGYNLQWAYTSAVLAVNSIVRE